MLYSQYLFLIFIWSMTVNETDWSNELINSDFEWKLEPRLNETAKALAEIFFRGLDIRNLIVFKKVFDVKWKQKFYTRALYYIPNWLKISDEIDIVPGSFIGVKSTENSSWIRFYPRPLIWNCWWKKIIL